MAAERTDEQIRAEISHERDELAQALTDLRAGVRAKRKVATAVGALAGAALAAAASLKVARRVRRG